MTAMASWNWRCPSELGCEVLPLARIRLTTSALYSAVNFRLFRRSMDPVSTISEVSTKSTQTRRGFHHHATLCAVAHGFLALRRALFPPEEGVDAR